MITGLFALLACQFIGELLSILTGNIIPGPVIGMFLLLGLLLLKGNVPEGVDKASTGMIQLLPLLLITPSVGLLFLGPAFNSQWPGFLAATIAGTAIAIVFTALLMKFLLRNSDKQGSGK